jgi:hypothetical protein
VASCGSRSRATACVERDLDLADQVGLAGDRGVPLGRREDVRWQPVAARRRDDAAETLRLAVVSAGDGPPVQLTLRRRGDRLELPQCLLLALLGADEVVAGLRGQALVQQRAEHGDALLREELLRLRQRGGGPHVGAQVLFAGELRGGAADGDKVPGQRVVQEVDLAQGGRWLGGVLELAAGLDLLAQLGEAGQLAVDVGEVIVELGRQVGESGPAQPIPLGGVLGDGDLLVERRPRVVVGVAHEQRCRRPLVLQLMHQRTALLGDPGQRARAVGIARAIDVVDQTRHTDHDGGDGGNDHDEPELGPDRRVTKPTRRQAQTRELRSPRRWPFAHLTAPPNRCLAISRHPRPTDPSAGRTSEIPPCPVAKRKPSLAGIGYVGCRHEGPMQRNWPQESEVGRCKFANVRFGRRWDKGGSHPDRPRSVHHKPGRMGEYVTTGCQPPAMPGTAGTGERATPNG